MCDLNYLVLSLLPFACVLLGRLLASWHVPYTMWLCQLFFPHSRGQHSAES